LRSFYVLTIWVCNFWRKDFGAKVANKMLVKLTHAQIIFQAGFASQGVSLPAKGFQ
jgi:hypothetical protein